MKYKIRGASLPTVDIQLSKGESVFTESGGMSWMSINIAMKTSTEGGLLKGLGRTFAGESMFLTRYTCEEGEGLVSFSSEFPGVIIDRTLAEGEKLICQKDAFMVGQTTLDVGIDFRKKLGAGFFGGEGFILQKVTGPGICFFEISGDVTEYELEKGQQLKVDPGHLAFFEPSVDYNISRVKGVKNILFGGEGLFLALLTGPGKVWLQSMPISNLAATVARTIGRK